MNTTDIAGIVTDRIIAAMEEGTVPWRKPWTGHGGPTSLATGKTYRGINYLILELVAQAEGYALPLWGTYKQFQAMGGSVTKGEKGTPVVLWKPMEKQNPEGDTETYMLMRYFTVFNIAQTNVEAPEKYLIAREPVSVLDGVEAALNYPGGPTVTHRQQDKAYYTATADEIVLPLLEQFHSPESYASTALHEATHSTGHSTRLNRLDGAAFGCQKYAAEELVAEIGAAMLATALNIEVAYDQTATYLSSWLKVLKDDRKMLIQAAQKAQKAVDLILPPAAVMEAAA